MKYYFAYGSCTNIASFEETLQKANCHNKYRVVGIGRLDNHRPAFTRKKMDGTGALDVVVSYGDYVLGLIYEVPEEAISVINQREGHPNCYIKTDNVLVDCQGKALKVFTYLVVNKQLQEVCPSNEYFIRVLEGLKNKVPDEYINKYLINHYENKFERKVPVSL